MIVLPDADIDMAADAAVSAAYGSAGERCMAVSMVVAVGAVARSADRGDQGAHPEGQGRRRDGSVVGDGAAHHARASRQGRVVPRRGQGARRRTRELSRRGLLPRPSLIDDVKPGMRAYEDEIFGPVLGVTRVDTYDEAVRLVNESPYGNGTAIFTRDGGVARQFQFDAQAGMVGINVPIPVPVAYYSFGGWKTSLFGDRHIYGPEGIDFYTRARWSRHGGPIPRRRRSTSASRRRARCQTPSSMSDTGLGMRQPYYRTASTPVGPGCHGRRNAARCAVRTDHGVRPQAASRRDSADAFGRGGWQRVAARAMRTDRPAPQLEPKRCACDATDTRVRTTTAAAPKALRRERAVAVDRRQPVRDEARVAPAAGRERREAHRLVDEDVHEACCRSVYVPATSPAGSEARRASPACARSSCPRVRRAPSRPAALSRTDVDAATARRSTPLIQEDDARARKRRRLLARREHDRGARPAPRRAATSPCARPSVVATAPAWPATALSEPATAGGTGAPARARRRRRRRLRPARARRGDDERHRRSDVARRERVRRLRRTRIAAHGRAARVAAPPLVGERRRGARPGADGATRAAVPRSSCRRCSARSSRPDAWRSRCQTSRRRPSALRRSLRRRTCSAPSR